MGDQDSKMHIRQKGIESTYIADNLDNTATTEKIIEHLQATHRKNKVALLYAQTIRQKQTNENQFQVKHYLLSGYPLNTFSEDWDGGLKSGYFEEFSYRSMMPKIISTMKNIEKKDPVTELLLRKQLWKEDFIHYKIGFCKTKKKLNYKWINDEVLYCPKTFVQIAEHYERDPDVYFNSNYNWYYAGNGNIHLKQNYLLHSEFNTFYVLPFDKNNLLIDYDTVIAKFVCDTDIFETAMMQNIIALRTKHTVYILKFVELDSGLYIEKIKELHSKLPFTGISFDEYHTNILYVTTLDYKLTIVNIDRMSGRSKQLRGNVPSLVDNWSTVIGSERGHYMHVAKTAVTLYDKRTNKAFQRWKNLRRVTDDRACNDISVARYCKRRPFVYLGTDHHLFLMDLRYDKTKDNKVKVVQRWSHGMQSLPTYMTICDNFEYDKHLICISSQWCEDMCVVSNYTERPTSEHDVRGVAIPYRPPNLPQLLKVAREKSLCCDIKNPIDLRLCTSTTGLSVVQEGDHYHVLMLNSLGDISLHTLFPRYMTAFFDDNAAELLHEWSQSFKREVKDFKVSFISDISKYLKQLKRIPDDYDFGDSKNVRKAHKFSEQEIFESFERQELDASLLDIWMKTSETATNNKSTLNSFFYDNDEQDCNNDNNDDDDDNDHDIYDDE